MPILYSRSPLPPFVIALVPESPLPLPDFEPADDPKSSVSYLLSSTTAESELSSESSTSPITAHVPSSVHISFKMSSLVYLSTIQ